MGNTNKKNPISCHKELYIQGLAVSGEVLREGIALGNATRGRAPARKEHTRTAMTRIAHATCASCPCAHWPLSSLAPCVAVLECVPMLLTFEIARNMSELRLAHNPLARHSIALAHGIVTAFPKVLGARGRRTRRVSRQTTPTSPVILHKQRAWHDTKVERNSSGASVIWHCEMHAPVAPEASALAVKKVERAKVPGAVGSRLHPERAVTANIYKRKPEIDLSWHMEIHGIAVRVRGASC